MKKHISNKVKRCFAPFLFLLLCAPAAHAAGPKTGAMAEIVAGGDSLKASERMVNVAYGKQSYNGIASSIGTVYSDELRKSTVNELGDALTGRLPGLTVINGGYEPGSKPSLYLRGKNTYGGNQQPLVLVDGFRTDYNQISLFEIESVSVLKDASAVALYGMEGANGVILITTKRGYVGKTAIDINVDFGVQQFATKPDLLNAYEYAVLYNQARANDGLTMKFDPVLDIPNYGKGGVYQYTHPDNNYFDLLTRSVAPIGKVGINIGGGTKSVRYMVTGAYLYNGGMYKHTDENKYSTQTRMNRFNLRANLDVNISKHLSAQIDMSGRIDVQDYPGRGQGDIFPALLRTPPMEYPLTNPDGSLGGSSQFQNNPYGQIARTGYINYLYRNLDMSLRLKYDFNDMVEGLSINVGGSMRNNTYIYDNKTRNFAVYDITSAPDPVTGAGEYKYHMYNDDTDLSWNHGVGDQQQRLNFEAGINYDRTFGEHAVSAMLMYHMDRYSYNASHYTQNNAGLGLRAHYGFRDRYFAEFTASYYGQEQYMPGRRFGFFPAGALAWVISKEDFLKDSKAVNYLKLRASYGKVGGNSFTGSSVSDRIFYQQYFDTGRNGSSFGTPQLGSGYSGTQEGRIANPYITWDKSYKTDISIEGTFFNHLSVMFDYFHDVRKDILTQNTYQIPMTWGVTAGYGNGGEVTNRGYEATLEVFGTAGDFEYSVQGNIWFNHNMMTKKPDAARYDMTKEAYYSSINKYIGQTWGFVCDGFYTKEMLENETVVSTLGTLQEGDCHYIDINGDGVIDDYDRVPLGYGDLPRYSYSFGLNLRYKNVYLYALGQGTMDGYMFLNNDPDAYIPFWNDNNAFQYAKSSWTPQTASTATLPRLSTLENKNNSRESTVWMRSTDYFKLRTLEVGYDFPQRWMQKIHFKGAKVYFRGQNLFTLAKDIDFVDPETTTSYPATRSYSIGLSLTF